MKELLIKSNSTDKEFFLIEDERIVEYYKEKNNNQTLEGNIYIGKVQNIISGLDAAFVNLGEGKNAFIHKKDLLPKEDVTKNKSTVNTPITKLIKPGMPLLVEIKKDKIQTKGAKASTHITLRGRFIVLMPNAPFVTVSSKIEGQKRAELKEFVKQNLPDEVGAIVRTSAEFASEEDIKKDIEKQLQRWQEIQNINVDGFPKKIYDSGGITKKTITDLVDYKLDRIIVNNEEIKKIVQDILNEIGSKIQLNVYEKDLEDMYNIKKELLKIDNNKIWLKSGAFISIDCTEALTAIDVNTGKFIGKSNTEETVFKVNVEAAVEICRELRLRDIGGIIIIDFIDMKEKENRENLIEVLRQESKKDRSRLQIEGFTKLNLVECTRKHIAINFD